MLYIEDNPVNVLLMEAMLASRRGCACQRRRCPSRACSWREPQPPDLVLLDIQLPGIDGYEVLRRLRADEARATSR